MTHPRHFGKDPKTLRELLREVDNHRLFVRVGFNSLSGYCCQGLEISKWFFPKFDVGTPRIPDRRTKFARGVGALKAGSINLQE